MLCQHDGLFSLLSLRFSRCATRGNEEHVKLLKRGVGEWNKQRLELKKERQMRQEEIRTLRQNLPQDPEKHRGDHSIPGASCCAS